MEFDILSLSPQGGNICLCCEHKQLVIFIVFFFFSFVLMKMGYTVQNIPALAL